jgi:hypothetical protein
VRCCVVRLNEQHLVFDQRQKLVDV